jgi:hypothetical protein
MAVQWRFANAKAAARTKVLEKNGDHDIRLFDLPRAMTKDAAIDYVSAQIGGKPAEAPKAAAKVTVPKVAKVTKKAQKAQEEADRLARGAKSLKEQAPVNKADIEFEIDEDLIPDFIKKDFRRG